MSDLTAKVAQTTNGFDVKGVEDINYGFQILDGVFEPKNEQLAQLYAKWGRVLVVLDETVNGLYGQQIRSYFDAHRLPPTFKVIKGGELNKTMDTMLQIVDAFDAFGLVRKEPVLVVGGGLVTDVTGYACASYRRSSNFIRVPTTLIGLIDASVSIKVGLNWRKYKNRLGAYHAPLVTFLDFTFLRTLPAGQVRNGFAELVKISSVAEKRVWELLVRYGPQLVDTKFGRAEGADPEIKKVADEICWKGIKVMLELESPNLHELGLDRVIAFGHTWSPTLELTPAVPLRHGHAIAIDMCYSVTLAERRGMITAAERDQFLDCAAAVGLSLDHEAFNDELLEKATEAIKKTRDGKQRFAVPNPLGTCAFLNDVPIDELCAALAAHKALIRARYPATRGGSGVEAYVDAGDLGADVDAYLRATQGGYSAPQPGADDCCGTGKGNSNSRVVRAASAAGAVVDGRVRDGEGLDVEAKTVKVGA